MADKADGIRQDHISDIGDIQTAQRRVQRRKQLICGKDIGRCHSIKQRRLTGVGIAHQRHGRDVRFGSRLTSLLALFFHPLKTGQNLADTTAQQAAVGF